MCAKYTPTPLPVRIDISRADTGSQLKSINPPAFAEKSSHASKQDIEQTEMNRMFLEVVTSDLRSFLKSYPLSDVSGDSSVVFVDWMRAFHAEYDDAWFSKNRERLARSFRPIWDEYFNVSSGREGIPSASDLPDLLG